jgi:hypothetical protein
MTPKRPRDPNQLAKSVIDIAKVIDRVPASAFPNGALSGPD